MLSNEYRARKGDRVILLATVEHDQSAHGDSAQGQLFLKIDGTYNAQLVQRQHVQGVDRYALQVGDFVTADWRDSGPLEILAIHGDDAWVINAFGSQEIAPLGKLTPLRRLRPGERGITLQSVVPEADLPTDPPPSPPERTVPRVVAESPTYGDTLDSAGPMF